ncbi:MAG: hypothetical protein BMS9Abin29_2648 [Gemmatimonadota bacterium]|nr:MAG: hypothetical protein BMS9Abin29_2648 [Gemmatimonadota bacterium]
MNGRQGFTLVEVVIAVLIFALLMGGLVSAGVVASSQLIVSQNDVRVWKAATYQLEKLVAGGYTDLVSGSDTVQGFATAWTVTGTNPKKVLLVIDRKTLSGDVRPDSFVTYLASP